MCLIVSHLPLSTNTEHLVLEADLNIFLQKPKRLYAVLRLLGEHGHKKEECYLLIAWKVGSDLILIRGLAYIQSHVGNDHLALLFSACSQGLSLSPPAQESNQ